MRRLTRRFKRRERGQTLVLFAAIFFVTLGMGAFAVDGGMWLAKRRVAQKDADTAARGGAMVYLTNSTDSSGAETQARKVANQNGAPNNANTTFTGDNDCEDFRGNVINNVPSIHVEINEPTGSLFGRVFGIDGLRDLGAQATACVGEPHSLGGLDPFVIAPGASSPDPKCFDSDGDPRLGSICPIMVPSGYQDTGTRGLLSLQDDPGNLSNNETECTEPNNSNVDGQIVTSSGARCKVGDEVFTKQGSLSQIKGALRCRILGWETRFPRSDNPDERGAGNECPGPNGPNGYRSFEKAPGEGFCDRDFHISGTKLPPFANTLTPVFPSGDVINSPNGLDDVVETFSQPGGGPPTSLSGSQFLIANSCDGRQSPRVFTIIIAEGPAVNGKIRIARFASFYALGCWDLAGGSNSDFTGAIDPFCDNVNGNRTAFVGFFLNSFIPEGGDIGPCDPGEGCVSQTIVLVK